MAVVREVKYFDYMENGIRVCNVGHARVDWWEQNGEEGGAPEGSLYIHLSHIPEGALAALKSNLMQSKVAGAFLGDKEMSGSLEADTALGKVILGDICLRQGDGEYCCELTHLEEVLGAVIKYHQLFSLQVVFGEGKEALCKIHERTEESVMTTAADVHSEDGEAVSVSEPDLHAESVEQEADMEGRPNIQGHVSVESRQVSGPTSDKWDHLCAIYPKLTPFSDSREYLAVGPDDFVLLSSKYYSLIHNSFLLHGYYQYGQLVLYRVLKKGKPQYYLGTPGVYREQEKRVAIMYGFQSFECDSEPAMEGDFGYYMLPVEL